MVTKGSSSQARARVQRLTLTPHSGLALGESVVQSGPALWGMLLKADKLVLGAFPQDCRETDHSTQGLRSYNPPTQM